MRPRREPSSRLISTPSLLAETKAISAPEKKAESSKNIIMISAMLNFFYYPSKIIGQLDINQLQVPQDP